MTSKGIWKVRLERRAVKELSRIGSAEQARIVRFIKERLSNREDPRQLGQQLVGPFSGFWKFRVGDYRLIAQIDDETIAISIIRIGNRRDIYRR